MRLVFFCVFMSVSLTLALTFDLPHALSVKFKKGPQNSPEIQIEYYENKNWTPLETQKTNIDYPIFGFPQNLWIQTKRRVRHTHRHLSHSFLISSNDFFEVHFLFSFHLGWRLWDLHQIQIQKSPWSLVTANAPFHHRDGATFVEFQGQGWLLGGWKGMDLGISSEVWVTKDFKEWRQMPDAPWPARHGFGALVHQNEIYVVGGDGHSDVWKTADGESWTRVTAQAPWGARYTPVVCDFRGKIWLMGGQWAQKETPHQGYQSVEVFHDVWSSKDGRSWKMEVSESPWGPRSLIHGCARSSEKMYLMGGGKKRKPPYEGYSETTLEYNDVWSSTDGLNWELIRKQAQWRPRTHFSMFYFRDHLLVSDGSVERQGGLSNEFWVSKDGKDWKRLRGSPYPVRHASTLASFKGDLYLIGGYLKNDIWKIAAEDFDRALEQPDLWAQ